MVISTLAPEVQASLQHLDANLARGNPAHVDLYARMKLAEVLDHETERVRGMPVLAHQHAADVVAR